MNGSAAREALACMEERRRLLRAAYVSARYGWPETLASAWWTRPQTFEAAEPGCRAASMLAALAQDPFRGAR